MLKNIPLPRALAYFICLASLPLVFVFFFFLSETHALKELEEAMENIQHQAFLKENKQALNQAICHHFCEADHFYIDKYLETLVFLEPEIETLQKIVEDKNFSDNEQIKKRLEFLTGSSNVLAFSEGIVQTLPLFQETLESLVHPVEVNAIDIQKILSRVEGIKIGAFTPGPHRPQLLITEFKLDKKKIYDKNEVYHLDLKLIKREFS